jgi:hypothetical protein
VVQTGQPTVAVRTGGDTVTDAVTVVHFDVEDADPTARYVLAVVERTKGEVGRSVEFSPSSDGKWTWDDYIFPASGEYQVILVQDPGGTVGGPTPVTGASQTVPGTPGTGRSPLQ